MPQASSADLARSYLNDDVRLLPLDRSALENSLTHLRLELAGRTDQEGRSAEFQKANLALCRKRDLLRKKFGIDAKSSAADQANALAAHEEGSVLLNAFILLNQGLAGFVIGEFSEKKKFPERSVYDHDDRMSAALYGTTKKNDEDTERGIKGFSGGMLSAAINYDPQDTSAASFATYAAECMRDTLLTLENSPADKKTVRLHDITEMHGRDAKRLKEYDHDPETVTRHVAGAKREEVVKAVLETLTPRERDVLLRHAHDETLESIGANQNFVSELGGKREVTKKTIQVVKTKALRKLLHPSRSRLLRPFADEDPEIGR